MQDAKRIKELEQQVIKYYKEYIQCKDGTYYAGCKKNKGIRTTGYNIFIQRVYLV